MLIMLHRSILIGNINIFFHSYVEELRLLEWGLKNSGKNISIGYANSYTVVLSVFDSTYRKSLSEISFVFADGIGVHIAAKLLKPGGVDYHHIQNATDFNHKVLELLDQRVKKLFVIGGLQVSLEQFIEKVHKKFPNIIVVGACNGYVDIDSPEFISHINMSKPDVLLIALGQPKQELWYAKHKTQLSVPVIVIVGGFIDFFSGYKKRAPKIFQSLGLEWFFRLLQEPRRLWRRYLLGIPKFLYIVLRQKITQ